MPFQSVLFHEDDTKSMSSSNDHNKSKIFVVSLKKINKKNKSCTFISLTFGNIWF